MRKLRWVAFLLAVIVLGGCAASEEVAIMERETGSPPLLRVYSPDPTFLKTLPKYPFGLPEDFAVMDYDTYFSECREYSPESNCIISTSWKWATGGHYSLYSADKRWYVGNFYDKYMYAIPGVSEYASCNWILADGYWIYGLDENGSLFRIDYQGRSYELLLDGSTYSFDGLRRNFSLYNHCDLFFKADTADGLVYCRIYLPENRFEVLLSLDQISSDYGITQISNHELILDVRNPEFDPFFETVMADPESPFYGTNEAEARVSPHYDIPIAFLTYINTATGEQHTANSYGYLAGLRLGDSPRTAENIEKNGDAWWKDFQ